MPAAPVNSVPGAPVQPYAPNQTVALSGGAKFGYAALGFFLGVIGVLVAWLTTKDTPKSGDAIKFSVIGLAVAMVLGIIFFIIIVVLGASLAGNASSSYMSGYSSGF
jgi:membrane protease YdiL (CAAX protease family)